MKIYFLINALTIGIQGLASYLNNKSIPAISKTAKHRANLFFSPVISGYWMPCQRIDSNLFAFSYEPTQTFNYCL
mgnify:CR=1 FL=1